MIEQLENWLALSHVSGIGPAKFQKYLLADPELNILPKALKPDWAAVRRDLSWLSKGNCNAILTLLDEQYPPLLKKIANPPPILYITGNKDLLTRPQIAMVGSRNAQPYGIQQAFDFASYLTRLGLVVTSGLALGIDSASHKGALATATGHTIAVLGHGLDTVYPAANTELAEIIAARGVLVSEFAIGVAPLPRHFPQRNRIISGLSLGVLVVAAALKSGSLLTAEAALEQGREVFAIPGSIHSADVKGCHKLIRQGEAKLVETVEDIIEELGGLLKYMVSDTTAKTLSHGTTKQSLVSDYECILNKIDFDMTSVDSIVASSGLSVSEVSAKLLQLELDGYIMAVPGGFTRKLG